MNRKLLLAAAVPAAAILQTAVIPVHLAPEFKPDLLLILTVYLALHGEYELSGAAAWGLGLLKDVFGGMFLGLNAFCFLLIHLVVRHLSGRLYAESSSVFIVTVTASSAACALTNLLFLVMFAALPGISYSIMAGLVPYVLVNALIASLITLHRSFDDAPLKP